MAASHFVEMTDEEINCFKENAYFSYNHINEKIIRFWLAESSAVQV